MTLANLLGKGLEKAETDAAEVARYLEKIRRKLEDSKRAANHADTRFDIAFEALLQSSARGPSRARRAIRSARYVGVALRVPADKARARCAGASFPPRPP